MSRDDFVCDNLGLVHACAKRFAGRGIEYDDLFQAGCVGLVKAVDGFEPERGLCFSTYAVPLILGEMRHLFREGGAVKVSRSLRSLSLQAGRLRETLLNAHGREPTVEELAAELNIEPALAAQAVCVALPPLSLTRNEEGEEGQIDLPCDSPEETVTDKLALRQVLQDLPDRDRALIEMRYLRRMTQQATADRLGMTQVQVSRRERAILLELRRKLLE
ncbi:MAG: sigma-70 family RNA polymerase sigma factor [Clostridia bacterium]|nr:sigma-70 family RNA polymerase sigma factor [Clostridia bacterium]